MKPSPQSSTDNGTVIGRVLALDYGKKRTGVAVSDPTGVLVKPLAVIERANSSDGLDNIAALISTQQVTRIIVGLPIGLSGEETKQTAQAKSFAARLRAHVSVPVELYDERFTSRLADRTRALTGSNTSRDSLAASHILEAWMETNR